MFNIFKWLFVVTFFSLKSVQPADVSPELSTTFIRPPFRSEFGDETVHVATLYEVQPDGTVTVDLFDNPPIPMTIAPIVGDFNPSPQLASCDSLGEGTSPVFGSCTRYLECEKVGNVSCLGFIRRILECPVGLWYRHENQACGFQTSNDCPYGSEIMIPSVLPERVIPPMQEEGDGQQDEFSSACISDGEFPLPGCRGYYSCRSTPVSGAYDIFAFGCADALRWDITTKMCLPEKTVRCDIPEEGSGCTRTCIAGDTRICRHTFILEEFASMSYLCGDCPFNIADCSKPGCITAGGVRKALISINRRLPGPVVVACKGDILEIEVQNRLSKDAATIHWHGIHQRETPHMDGVAFITQCPIHPGNTFRYRMKADVSGTHLYHSHIGHQESDGFFGAMIIREPRDAEYGVSARYDMDVPGHHMLVWHWYARPADTESIDTRMQSLRREGFGLIINGKGTVKKTYNPKTGLPAPFPMETYEVRTGLRYRFRVIYNSALNCPIQVSIDKHTIDILAVDGRPVAPMSSRVESVFLSSGERVDFVPYAVNTFNNTYYIRVRALGFCDDQRNSVFQTALLRYDGNQRAPVNENTLSYGNAVRSGTAFNINRSLMGVHGTNNIIARFLTEARDANRITDTRITGKPNKVFYLDVAFQRYTLSMNMQEVLPQINKITWDSPASPPLTQPWSVTNTTFCNAEKLRNCHNGLCRCAHMLEMDNGDLVEIVLVDERGLGIGHPFHMHGYAFRVVAMSPEGGNVTLNSVKEQSDSIVRNFNGPLKDTVIVPTRGYVIIRFVANNPGYWFLHCHISDHMALGMALVMKVGKHSEMVKPPSNFPTCGNYF